MAAASQVPAGAGVSKTFITELIVNINLAVTLGVFAGSDTVTTALANLATDQAAR
jgi:hypothetical protein